jgi:hypothetical protein
MASALRRAHLPASAAQRLVIASGLGAGVVCAIAFLGPGSEATHGVLSAPLFLYGLLVGALVPGLVELLRLLRIRLPAPPFGLSRRTIEVDLAIVAAAGAVGLAFIGEDGTLGLVVGLVGAAGLLLGTRHLAD